MSNRLYIGSSFVGGPGIPAIVDSSTASSTASVAINEDIFFIYKFTGSGNIVISSPGFVDVLVQGGGGPGNLLDNSGGAGGGGGQVERLNVFVPVGTHPVRVGSGTGSNLALSNPAGTSSFMEIVAVGGAPASQFRDRMAGAGACGASRSNESIAAPSLGMFYQGRIGENLRGGDSDGINVAGGGVGSDTGNGYDPGQIWGSPGELGCGGNAGKPMSANTGNGGNAGVAGNSGLVLIRVKK
jgi:hypothetical protein